MLTPIDFLARSKEPIHTVETEEQKPKFARMSFDQVTDMHAETLLLPPSLLEHYAPIIEHYPGFKYIKKHLPIHFIGKIPF